MTYKSCILIVDDQLSAREVLRGLLTGENYDLAFAVNGQEALTKAAELVPDLILLDVMLPGMDGFEVCRQLRSDTDLAEIPVIMVTSLDDSDSRLKGLEAGADDFVAKPFSRAELRARVKTITRLNHLRRLHTLELQAERDRNRAILEALGEAVVVTNAEGVIQYVNPAVTKLTGFTAEEMLEQSWQTWQLSDLYKQIMALARLGNTWRGEVVSRRRNGSQYDAALTVAPLFSGDDQDEPIGFVSVQRDITPLKQAERSKNEFVSNVSHELRTPLSVITLISDNLDALYDRLPDKKRRKMIRDIQRHTQILNELIGDVLEISRIDSGRVSMERNQLELGKVAREQVRELAPLVQQKMQTIQLLGNQKLIVFGNKGQLKQIIRNLLNNAIKYTGDGGQIVCQFARLKTPLKDEDEAVWPGCQTLPDGPWAAVRVNDSGVGIDEKHLAHLFERFYRIKSENRVRGTGLGLAIVRELIELHNGYVAVTSTLGKGSTFAFYLPLVTETAGVEAGAA